MNNEEIKNYFGSTRVYKFDGTLAELNELMISIGNSYNYLVDQYQVYVVAQSEINDVRATLI